MGWQRTDDFTGHAPAEQVSFGLDGKAYTLDLGDDENRKFHQLLQRYLTVAVVYGEMPEPPAGPVVAVLSQTTEAARPEPEGGGVSAPTTGVRGGRAASVPASAGTTRGKSRADVPQREIRVWANANGYSVGPKGRIPEVIVSAFHEQYVR